ncbi:LysR family transcriptional regulator [Burkholderia multivorans]|uniref:LysR family transcriptional regulator n=1 Tax=Burkholderia ubonensis TaxID=101571 RepID=UPI000F6F160D|nr:LysR family transcriptional regulator [Burkholderia ubonensis]AYZ65623.1 LysR family transcriptional regulator [Burkholderia multivorans]
MDKLNGVTVFVQAAETRSFVATGRSLGISASAVGKSISRLEERLGVRLFYRNTRSIHLTPEGALFLGHCRRILGEIENAERELSKARTAPRGKLRVSLPLVESLLLSTLSSFMARYPEIELELDFSDRLVDIIDEGFDAVIRTGELRDSMLMSRKLCLFRMLLVASPSYLDEHGVPQHPDDLMRHACLHYKFPTSGKLEQWPIERSSSAFDFRLPVTMACNNVTTLVYLARQGHGIACLPDFAVRDALVDGSLRTVLDNHAGDPNIFWILWPSSRHESPKLRAFIDHLTEHLFAPASDMRTAPGILGPLAADKPALERLAPST